MIECSEERMDLESDLIVIQREIIPEVEANLNYLTAGDYKPDDNPDHELRDMDIENLSAELAKLRADEERINSSLTTDVIAGAHF